uniref:Uncharacterized protein n=1 Tax=Rhizophora mucronata TaxID=61149 RepID=A0A2P2QYY1_RHIMU
MVPERALVGVEVRRRFVRLELAWRGRRRGIEK